MLINRLKIITVTVCAIYFSVWHGISWHDPSIDGCGRGIKTRGRSTSLPPTLVTRPFNFQSCFDTPEWYLIHVCPVTVKDFFLSFASCSLVENRCPLPNYLYLASFFCKRTWHTILNTCPPHLLLHAPLTHLDNAILI